MLLEMAVADAFGIGFEFCDNRGRETAMVKYYQHPHYDDMVPGHYTDDTQRSIANAQVVLGKVGDGIDIYNPVTYITSLFEIYAKDPRPGYSRKFEAFLRENLKEEPEAIFRKIIRKGSNGSVMGAAVLGYLSTPEEVMHAAAAQAYSTHSYTTIPCAQIIALAAHYFIERIGPKAELVEFLSQHIDAAYMAEVMIHAPVGKVTMAAESVTGLMLATIPNETSLTRLIEIAVERGGETDSAAAVMVAIASCSVEYTHDLPQPLLDGLERGWHGFEHLVSIDNTLAELRATGAERDYLNWNRDTSFYSSISQIRASSFYRVFCEKKDISPVVQRIARGDIGINLLIALTDFFGDAPIIADEDRGRIGKCCAQWRQWLVEKGK